MRVANNSIFNAVVSNVMRNQERFLKLGEAIASGKRVQKLSTDPLALTQILRFRSTVASFEQYQHNIDRGNSWLSLSEGSLTLIVDGIIRAKELALAQASGTADATSRAAAAIEVGMLLQQTLEAANVRIGNQFLFAGRKTNVIPFLPDGTYQGDNGTFDFEVGQGTFMTINLPGDVVFQGTGGGVDVVDILKKLNTALKDNDQSAVNALLSPLDQILNQVMQARTEVGAKMGHLTVAKNRLAEMNDHVTRLLGETEGVDLAKAITDLTQQQFVYQASLAASAKIIQPTLLDFLR